MRLKIIFVLIAVSAVGSLINIYRPQNDTHLQFEYRRFWIEKTHNSSTYSLLICGDSRVYRGVSSNEVEKQLKGKFNVFNFGYSSGSYSDFMLDKIESKFSFFDSRQVVVLGITPYSLTAKAAIDGQIREELSRKREEIIEYRYFLPIKRYVEPLTIDDLRDFFRTKSVGTSYYQQKFYPKEGWVASSRVPIDSTRALKEYQQDFQDNKVSRELVNSLMLRMDKWLDKGIHVFAFRPPTTHSMVLLEDEISGFDQEEFVRQLKAKGVIWIDISNSGFVSYDGSHLTEESAEKLSNMLGKSIFSKIGDK